MTCGIVRDRDMNAAVNILQVGPADLPGGLLLAHGEKEGDHLGGQVQHAKPYAFVTQVYNSPSYRS